MFNKNKRQATQKIGCGFMFWTGLVVILLLSINGLFIRLFFSVNLSGINDDFFQAGQFVLPIVMLFIQFWFYDLLTLRRRAKKSETD